MRKAQASEANFIAISREGLPAFLFDQIGWINFPSSSK